MLSYVMPYTEMPQAFRCCASSDQGPIGGTSVAQKADMVCNSGFFVRFQTIHRFAVVSRSLQQAFI